MTPLQNELFSMKDPAYRAFHSRLMPTVDPERIIGVRVPLLRKYAKEFAASPRKDAFLQELPHDYYEENNLHAFLLERISDFSLAVEEVERFLPYVDNWATCDGMSPKVFGKHREELLPVIRRWIGSEKTYTIRYGIGQLMRWYLEEPYFRPEYLALAASPRSEEYYVRMMIAWYFATALAFQWDETVPWLEEKRLEPWVHKKTIRKAIESNRITPEQKEYLRTLG
ncbi:MAG: DNA alkylation repair protein [Oscillospiraceae bacterium]|nr:DNA alkylation repair protein [Oscillospiraceae bacterium]